MTEVERFMGRARRRWWTTTTLCRASQGGVAGGLAGMAVVLTHGPRPLALGLIATGLLLVPVFLSQRRPDEVALAARLDRSAGLGSALTAAVEFRQRADPWCAAQRDHAARLLAGLDPAALLPWRGIGWLVAATAALLAVTLLPPLAPFPRDEDGARAERQTLRAAERPSAPLPPGAAGGRASEVSSASGAPPEQVASPTAPTPALPREGREISPSPREGDGGRAEQSILRAAEVPAAPLPPGGAGGRAPGNGRASGAPRNELPHLTAPTPTLPRGGRGQGNGAGDGNGAASTGDIGTAAATTPLLGARDRALPRPGSTATLTLAGAALPGTVPAPSGAPPPVLRGLPSAPSPTVALAPPEAVPLHLRPTVARYFALLHPPTEADEP